MDKPLKIKFILLEEDAAEALTYDDVSLAETVLMRLKTLRQQAGGEVDSQYAKKLEKMEICLNFVRLPTLSEQKVLSLLENNLTYAFNIPDYQLTDKLKKFISYLEVDEARIQFMQKLVQVLEKSKLQFGNGEITVDGQKGPAVISRWLADYTAFPTKNLLRANIDMLNYLNKSPNIRILDDQEKPRLMELLKIYDSLKNRISQYNSAPAENDSKKAFENFDLAAMLPGVSDEVPPIPANVRNILEEKEGVRQAAVATVAASPMRSVDGVKEQSQPPRPAPEAAAVAVAAPPKPAVPAAPARPKPVEEILKARAHVQVEEADPYLKGLRLSGHGGAPVNMDTMRAEMEKKRRETEEKINKKLQTLKTKTGTK